MRFLFLRLVEYGDNPVMGGRFGIILFLSILALAAGPCARAEDESGAPSSSSPPARSGGTYEDRLTDAIVQQINGISVTDAKIEAIQAKGWQENTVKETAQPGRPTIGDELRRFVPAERRPVRMSPVGEN